MSLARTIGIACAAAGLFASLSASATSTAALPTSGRFTAYGEVTALKASATSADCSNYDAVGTATQGSLQLNVANLTEVYRTPQYTSTGVNTLAYHFSYKASTTLKSQSGTVTLYVNGVATSDALTFYLTLTPADVNSFNGTLTIAGLPPASGTGSCEQVSSISFIAD